MLLAVGALPGECEVLQVGMGGTYEECGGWAGGCAGAGHGCTAHGRILGSAAPHAAAGGSEGHRAAHTGTPWGSGTGGRRKGGLNGGSCEVVPLEPQPQYHRPQNPLNLSQYPCGTQHWST